MTGIDLDRLKQLDAELAVARNKGNYALHVFILGRIMTRMELDISLPSTLPERIMEIIEDELKEYKTRSSGYWKNYPPKS